MTKIEPSPKTLGDVIQAYEDKDDVNQLNPLAVQIAKVWSQRQGTARWSPAGHHPDSESGSSDRIRCNTLLLVLPYHIVLAFLDLPVLAFDVLDEHASG